VRRVSRLLSFPAGRRAKWVVFAVWIAAFAVTLGADLPGKFADAEQNESASFLPADAESTRALQAAEELQDGEEVALVVVYRRDGGLTAADRRTIGADREALEGLRPRYPQLGAFAEPVPSEDGTSALLVAPLKTDGQSATIIDPVDDVRERLDDRDGLQVAVTGSAGFSADAIKVFETIDGTLVGAAVGLVFILLALIYRSPLFLWIPLLAVVAAEVVTRGLGWGLTEAGVTVNGQSSAILSVLVLGAGTDYALLLVARFREELRRSHDKHEALARALRTAGPAVVASAVTVVLALLSLSIAEVNGTAGLGPIGAMGIVVAMLAMLTFLPAMLAIFGRRAFWPRVPHVGDTGADETHGAWRRVGDRVAARPRRVWAGTATLLAVCAVGLVTFSTDLTQGNAFRDEVESVTGQDLLAQAFPGGGTAPTDVVVSSPDRVPAVTRALEGFDRVAEVRPAAEGGGRVLLQATLAVDPYSTEAYDLVDPLRERVRAADPEALVGGATAVEADLRAANVRDTARIVPITLAVVLLVLVVLLRSLLAPLLLIGTVILSFLAALGVGAVVFDVVFGFPGSDTSLPLYAFVFLVALGIDYNIFLMARVREEVARHGTHDGMLRGLAVTGGVITSAGIVLAGVFSVLAVLPLVFLTQIGFVIAFGVLLDTFLVRSVLVPALVLDIGDRVWWPSRPRAGAPGATVSSVPRRETPV
jgi:putative drug exporter of the RND superfamily